MDPLATIAAIGDGPRRELYEYVARQAEPVGREQAADAVGIPRATAAFHLDRLVEAGALEVDFGKRTGRTGPGSGRPAKLYRRARAEYAVSLPARHYDLASELLAAAIEESERSGEAVRDALDRVAENTGRELGERSGGPLETALEELGYEPRDDGAGGLVLVNCPFHRLATSHTEVICRANVCLIRGVAEGTGDEADVQFAPRADHCCVRVAHSGYRSKSQAASSERADT